MASETGERVERERGRSVHKDYVRIEFAESISKWKRNLIENRIQRNL